VPASSFGVPKLRCSRRYFGSLVYVSLGVDESLRDAVWVGGGMGVGSSLVIARGSPAVFANARVTPRAGMFFEACAIPGMLASCPLRPLRLACDSLTRFRRSFPSDPL
jgi:hypothetical protein